MREREVFVGFEKDAGVVGRAMFRCQSCSLKKVRPRAGNPLARKVRKLKRDGPL